MATQRHMWQSAVLKYVGMTDNLSIGILGRACLSDWQRYDAHVCEGLSEHANHTAITPPYFGSIWCHRQTLLKVKPIILTTWR